MKNIKKRTYQIISVAKNSDTASKVFDSFIILLIMINIIILIIETYDISEELKLLLRNIEIFSVVIFTIEYALRIWTAEYLYQDDGKLKAKVKYIFSIAGIIDLLAILPLYLPNTLPKGMLIIRSCRTLRILKLMNINKRFDAVRIVASVLKRKFTQLISTFM